MAFRLGQAVTLQTLAERWKEVLFQICISAEKKNHQEVKEDIFTNCPYVDVYKESSRIIMV